MAKVKVHAGDFPKGDGHFFFGSLVLGGYTIPGSQLEEVAVASEENVKKVGGTLGWGAAGAVILGPVGLLAGLLLGGRKKEVTFVARLKDGRKILATTDNQTFIKLQSAAFK
jgi:hypothetical protein